MHGYDAICMVFHLSSKLVATFLWDDAFTDGQLRESAFPCASRLALCTMCALKYTCAPTGNTADTTLGSLPFRGLGCIHGFCSSRCLIPEFAITQKELCLYKLPPRSRVWASCIQWGSFQLDRFSGCLMHRSAQNSRFQCQTLGAWEHFAKMEPWMVSMWLSCSAH